MTILSVDQGNIPNKFRNDRMRILAFYSSALGYDFRMVKTFTNSITCIKNTPYGVISGTNSSSGGANVTGFSEGDLKGCCNSLAKSIEWGRRLCAGPVQLIRSADSIGKVTVLAAHLLQGV